MKLSQLHEEVEKKGEVLIVKPPARASKADYKNRRCVFLAGSIEMGKAEDWQTKLTDALIDDKDLFNIAVFNPRRDDWDSSWKQEIENKQFNEQVTWELDHLDMADIIAVYFDPKTKSPITLMEVGIHAKDDKMIVCCPKGYWRKGNVDIVCKRNDIPVVESLDELIAAVKKKLAKLKSLK